MPPEIPLQETAFEKRRGISEIRLETGYAQVHIGGLGEPVHAGRLLALRIVKECGVGIFFLRFTPSGLSFLVKEPHVEALRAPLAEHFPRASIRSGRSVVFVYAVNIRDEEGLLARALSAALASGAKIEHLGDMHDCLCLAVETESAEKIVAALRALEVTA